MLQASFGWRGSKSFPTRHDHLASHRQLASERQRLLAVDPVGLIPAHSPAFSPQYDVNTPVAEAHASSSQLVHPTPERPLRVLHAAVVKDAASNAHQAAGPSPTGPVVGRCT